MFYNRSMPQLPPPRPPRRKRATSKRPPLTPDAVVAAALDVLSAPGFAGLSMRDVAEHLGVGTAAVYAQVASKDELLELVYDALVGRVAIPGPSPPGGGTRSSRSSATSSPCWPPTLTPRSPGSGASPPQRTSCAGPKASVPCSEPGGLPTKPSPSAWTSSSCTSRRAPSKPAPTSARCHPTSWPVTSRKSTTTTSPSPPTLTPCCASIAPDMIGHDAASRFRFGIDAILTGLEKY